MCNIEISELDSSAAEKYQSTCPAQLLIVGIQHSLIYPVVWCLPSRETGHHWPVSYPEVTSVRLRCPTASQTALGICVCGQGNRVLINCSQWSPEGCSAHLKFGEYTLSNEQLHWAAFSDIQISLQECPGVALVLCHIWQSHLDLLDTQGVSDDIRHQCVGS